MGVEGEGGLNRGWGGDAHGLITMLRLVTCLLQPGISGVYAALNLGIHCLQGRGKVACKDSRATSARCLHRVRHDTASAAEGNDARLIWAPMLHLQRLYQNFGRTVCCLCCECEALHA